MNQRLPKAALATSLIAAGLLVACGGGGGGGGGTGTLSVSLTDAPACGFTKVNVTVTKVSVQSDEASEWVDIPVTLQNPKINLLDWTNGKTIDLGETTLPAGRYTQLRLVLAPNIHGQTPANSVELSDGTEIALKTPSGERSGLKLNSNIEIAADNTTGITLDFDACKSIVKRGDGQYNLKPVISIIPEATAGAISGYIQPTVAAANNPVVSAQVNGEIIRSTVPNSDGSFSLDPISAGTYDIVVTADAHASDVITAVPVTAHATTALGTLEAPLTLSTSSEGSVGGTVNVPANGPVSLADAAPTITATQTFTNGKKVAIKYLNVDVGTGSYSMNLPVVASRIAQFGSGTPVADSGTAGQYGIDVAATGYQPQSSSVVVSTGGTATKNFTLAP